MKPISKLKHLTYGVLMLLSGVTIKSNAQITNAGLADTRLDIHNLWSIRGWDALFQDMQTINTDMKEYPGYNAKLFGVVYQGTDLNHTTTASWPLTTPQNYSGYYLEFQTNSSGPIPMVAEGWLPTLSGTASGTNPDIAIGDDRYGTPGMDHIAVIVYEDQTANSILLSTVNITNIGSAAGGTPPTASALSAPMRLNTPLGHILTNPRVDFFGDLNTTTFSPGTTGGTQTIQALTQFIVTWSDYDPYMGISTIWCYYADVSNINMGQLFPLVPGVPFGGPQGIKPDVAAMGVKSYTIGGSLPERTAYITYIDPLTNDLKLTQIDFVGAAYTTMTHYTIESSLADIQAPRIECKAIGDDYATTGEATWEIAASVIPAGGSMHEIHAWNDVLYNTSGMPDVYTLSGTDEHFQPAVAGVGKDMTSLYHAEAGQDNFSLIYNTTYNNNGCTHGDIFTNVVDIATGTTSTTYPNYYEVNYSQQFSTPTGADIPTAITSSSNTGLDFLSVWYTGFDPMLTIPGGQIYCKFSKSNYVYKPSRVNELANAAAFTIFPNPATSEVNIALENQLKQNDKFSFILTDMTGKAVYSIDKADAEKNIINIKLPNLAKGIYMANVSVNNTKRIEKLVIE